MVQTASNLEVYTSIYYGAVQSGEITQTSSNISDTGILLYS